MKAFASIALAALALAAAGCGSESTGGNAGDAPDGGTAGVGLSVQEALLVGLDAPQLVSGYLIEEGGTLKLCDSLEESEPPGCGEPSVTVEGDTLPDLPRGQLVDVTGQITGTTFTPTEGQQLEVRELAPGLWRWTALHPDWTPDEDWEQEVGCVYLEAPSTVLLIDPLVPGEPEQRETFLARLDEDVQRNGKPVAILLTTFWHERSTGELAERYGAAVWAHEAASGRIETPVTNPFVPGDVLPGGVIAIDGQRAFETIYWLPEQRALVPGDAVLGDGEGGLRVPPEAWLRDTTQAELKLALRALLDLPVELVLVSHGEPVLEDGHAALAAALHG